MTHTLRTTGIIVLALAVGLLLGGEFGWVPTPIVDAGLMPLALLGAISLALGILLGVLSPLGRRMRQGRCVRCGAPTERGQTYCLDHLRSTVDEYRDQNRRHTAF